MKRKIRCQALGLRRINPSPGITNLKHASGRLAILVPDRQSDIDRRPTLKQGIHFITKANILRTLPHIETHPRFSSAGIPTVELKDTVFEFESTKSLSQRLGIVGLERQPTILDLIGCRVVQHAPIGTCRFERSSHPCLVVHLHQELCPTILHQLGLGRTRSDLDAHFRIDVDTIKTSLIQNLLKLHQPLVMVWIRHGPLKGFFLVSRKGKPQIFGSLHQAPHLCRSRLPGDVGDFGEGSSTHKQSLR